MINSSFNDCYIVLTAHRYLFFSKLNVQLIVESSLGEHIIFDRSVWHTGTDLQKLSLDIFTIAKSKLKAIRVWKQADTNIVKELAKFRVLSLPEVEEVKVYGRKKGKKFSFRS